MSECPTLPPQEQLMPSPEAAGEIVTAATILCLEAVFQPSRHPKDPKVPDKKQGDGEEDED